MNLQTQQRLEQERAAMEAEEAQRQAQQQQWNAEMAKQVSTIQPWATEFGDRWYKKISVGTLVYAYTASGRHRLRSAVHGRQHELARPREQFLQSIRNQPHYLDFKFSLIDDISMRITPDMYTTI